MVENIHHEHAILNVTHSRRTIGDVTDVFVTQSSVDSQTEVLAYIVTPNDEVGKKVAVTRYVRMMWYVCWLCQ